MGEPVRLPDDEGVERSATVGVGGGGAGLSRGSSGATGASDAFTGDVLRGRRGGRGDWPAPADDVAQVVSDLIPGDGALGTASTATESTRLTESQAQPRLLLARQTRLRCGIVDELLDDGTPHGSGRSRS